MTTTPLGMDLPETPRRYLRRQWKRNKPVSYTIIHFEEDHDRSSWIDALQHLRASDSLPSLHLCPNRPLFVCAQCGFSNTLIPMCLWCTWSSEAAKRKFEEKLPRARRMTAPAVLASHLRSGRARVKRVPGRVPVDTSIGPMTPQGDLMSCRGGFQVPVVTAVLDSCTSELACSTHPEDVQKTLDVMPDAHEIYPQGDRGNTPHDVATATSNSVNIACRLLHPQE
jgi:hypothetical protein